MLLIAIFVSQSCRKDRRLTAACVSQSLIWRQNPLFSGFVSNSTNLSAKEWLAQSREPNTQIALATEV